MRFSREGWRLQTWNIRARRLKPCDTHSNLLIITRDFQGVISPSEMVDEASLSIMVLEVRMVIPAKLRTLRDVLLVYTSLHSDGITLAREFWIKTLSVYCKTGRSHIHKRMISIYRGELDQSIWDVSSVFLRSALHPQVQPQIRASDINSNRDRFNECSKEVSLQH